MDYKLIYDRSGASINISKFDYDYLFGKRDEKIKQMLTKGYSEKYVQSSVSSSLVVNQSSDDNSNQIDFKILCESCYY